MQINTNKMSGKYIIGLISSLRKMSGKYIVGSNMNVVSKVGIMKGLARELQTRQRTYNIGVDVICTLNNIGA